jgi:membrane protease YdiL (CAAX protease family)
MTQPNFLARNALLVFFAATLGFSAVVAYAAHTAGNKNLSILIPLSPSLIAAVVIVIAFGRRGLIATFKGRVVGGLNLRWSLVALLLFPVLASTALLIHSYFGGPPLGFRTTAIIPQVIVILLISLGEEFGWRGFALPRLQQRFSPLNASLILGLVWGFWHFPGFLTGTGVPLDMPFSIFLLWTVLATILMTWVYNNTGGSILSAILMHSTANASFNYLPLLPEWVGQTSTFSIFLGLLFIVVALVIARFGMKRSPR